MVERKQGLVWVDLEMTGLDPDRDLIIEIATIITDRQLETLAIGPVLAIHQGEASLCAMDEWNRDAQADGPDRARTHLHYFRE